MSKLHVNLLAILHYSDLHKIRYLQEIYMCMYSIMILNHTEVFRTISIYEHLQYFLLKVLVYKIEYCPFLIGVLPKGLCVLVLRRVGESGWS